MEVRDYLRAIRRRWRVVALFGLLFGALAAAYTFTVTPQYASSAQLFVTTPSSGSSSDASYQGALFSQQRVQSYAIQVGTRDMASKVLDDLDLDLTPAELADKVSASVVTQTVILTITATDPDAATAQQIAQAYAAELGDWVEVTETPPGQAASPVKATISEAADLPDSPTSPDVVRNLVLGALAGILLGLGAAVLREHLDNSIRGAEDVAKVTTVSTLGTIPFDTDTRSKPLITSLDTHAPRAETFRVLRTNLQFVDVDRQNKVFVLSSAVPEEGKTTTSVNLALALAQAGQRTLLIEGDLRRPRAAALLDVDQTIGVTTVLVGRVSIDDAIQKVGDLHLLGSGAIPPNPAELLQSQAMSDLLEQARQRYDIVLIDAPPLLPVTDAALLAAQADGALMVVRHGRTTRDQLAQAIKRLEQVEAVPVGVVLNMVPTRGLDTSYSYYGYAPKERPQELGAVVAHSHRA